MTPTTLDITIERGLTFGPIVFAAKDTLGAAVNLTGWLAYAHVRKSPLGVLIASLAPTISSAAAGEITITLTDEQTLLLATGSYVWDLALEAPGGVRLGRYFAGRCTINRPVTQP